MFSKLAVRAGRPGRPRLAASPPATGDAAAPCIGCRAAGQARALGPPAQLPTATTVATAAAPTAVEAEREPIARFKGSQLLAMRGQAAGDDFSDDLGVGRSGLGRRRL